MKKLMILSMLVVALLWGLNHPAQASYRRRYQIPAKTNVLLGGYIYWFEDGEDNNHLVVYFDDDVYYYDNQIVSWVEFHQFEVGPGLELFRGKISAFSGGWLGNVLPEIWQQGNDIENNYLSMQDAFTTPSGIEYRFEEEYLRPETPIQTVMFDIQSDQVKLIRASQLANRVKDWPTLKLVLENQ
jgi:hypothetical protein